MFPLPTAITLTPAARSNEPVPVKIRLVAGVELFVPLLQIPAMPMVESTVMFRLPRYPGTPVLVTEKTAVAVGLQTTGDAVGVESVAHWGVVRSQVPLAGTERPLLSQNKNSARALLMNSASKRHCNATMH